MIAFPPTVSRGNERQTLETNNSQMETPASKSTGEFNLLLRPLSTLQSNEMSPVSMAK